jgi:hypothetical protein
MRELKTFTPVMHKALFLTFFGAALFAAGYWVRQVSAESPEGPRRNGALVPVAGEQTASGTGAAGRGDAAGAAARPFIPGRPFEKGQAREWILGLLPSLSGDRRADLITLMNIAPVFLTMDAASVQEAMAAMEELRAAEDAKNPDRRRNPNGDGKLDSLLMLTMIRLAQTDPESALTALKADFDHNDGLSRMLVLGRLAEDDPQRAERLALSLDKKQQREALQAIVYSLSGKDPAGALAFAARHPGALDEHDRKRILEGWVRRDPQPAMAAAIEQAALTKNTEVLRNTIEEWCKVDTAAAALWAAGYDGPGSVAARAMVLERRMRDDPQAALTEYAALQQAGGDPRELSRLTRSLADSLAKKDVRAARDWAESLPEGASRDMALHQVAEQWVKTDAPAASEWIRALPAGKLRDGAARELSSALARRDPASAFAWARSIENEELRGGALHNVIQNWREQDPDAAKAALESLPAGMRPGN